MRVNSKTRLGAKIWPYKRRGEWVEMCFMKRAAEHGLEVSKPWGDSASYDFIVEKGHRMARVQVKSTIARQKGAYVCQMHRSRCSTYKANDFDFAAVYLILEDIWYIIPASMLRVRFNLNPRLKNSKYEPCREAWHEMPGTPAKSGTVASIEACAEKAISLPFSFFGSQGEASQMLLAGG